MNFIHFLDPTVDRLQVMPEAKRSVPLFVNKEIWPSELGNFGQPWNGDAGK
jgi:hypothetical protein